MRCFAISATGEFNYWFHVSYVNMKDWTFELLALIVVSDHVAKRRASPGIPLKVPGDSTWHCSWVALKDISRSSACRVEFCRLFGSPDPLAYFNIYDLQAVNSRGHVFWHSDQGQPGGGAIQVMMRNRFKLATAKLWSFFQKRALDQGHQSRALRRPWRCGGCTARCRWRCGWHCCSTSRGCRSCGGLLGASHRGFVANEWRRGIRSHARMVATSSPSSRP